MSIHPGLFGPAELERRVAARMARQQILAKENPPHLHFILDEMIVQRLVGDKIVMHDQMRKLLAAIDKPNITIQILPRDVGGSPGLEGPFSILTLPDPIPDIGYTEGAAGNFYIYIEDRDRVREMSTSEHLTQLQWRKSTFSGDTGTGNGGTCVEVTNPMAHPPESDSPLVTALVTVAGMPADVPLQC